MKYITLKRFARTFRNLGKVRLIKELRLEKLSLNCLSKNVKCMFVVFKLKEMNITGLKIPTGGRQTSWLYISMTEELN